MPIFDSEYPVPVTGTVTVGNFATASFPAGFNVNVTASVPLQVTASVPNLTASISNFPAFPSGYNSNITASITLPVSATNPVTASIANFPAGFQVDITASIPLNVTSTQASPIWVTGAIDVINDLTGTVTVTGTVAVDNFPAFPTGYNVNVTASVPLQVTASVPNLTASISNFPVGFQTNITQSITLPVSATNPVTASVANFPTDQVVHGLVEITASVVIGVSQSNPVTSSVANWPVGFNAGITSSIPLNVTSTQASPVWVTGTIDVINDLTGTVVVTGAVSVDNFPTGFNSNITASIPLQVTASVPNLTASISNFPAFPTGYNSNITASITLPVSATNPVTASIANFPAGFQVNLTQSIPLFVTASIPATVTVTASAANRVAIGVFDATGADMDLFKDGDNLAIGGDHGLATLAVADGTPRKYHFLKTDETNNWLWVTGSVTSLQGATVAVSATNPVTASIANFPTGQNVNITGSNVFLSASVVGGSSSSFYWRTAAAAATVLASSSAGRKGVTVYNSGTTAVYVMLGTAASLTRFTCVVGTGGYYEAPYGWTGEVNGIWVGSPLGSASITEVF